MRVFVYPWILVQRGLSRPGKKTDRLGETWELPIDELGFGGRLARAMRQAFRAPAWRGRG